MRMSIRDHINFPKIVTILAVVFGIGVGLCGLDYFLAAHNIGKSHEEFGVGPLDGVSILVMLLSAAGLVLAVLAWIVAAILGRTGSGRDEANPQTPFHSTDDSTKDDNSR
jgi:hypothetical protein